VKLTRLLVLVSIVFLAARPVMACCLAGHGELAPLQVQAETPPCHEVSKTEALERVGTDRQRPPLIDCPGCFDCDTATLQAQSGDDGALTARTSPQGPVAIPSSGFVAFEHAPYTFKTGPPEDPLLRPLTPITLKQRLLI